MKVALLRRVMEGLPENSTIMFIKDGKLVPAELVAITRTQELPELSTLPQTRAFHSTREAIIIADKETLETLEKPPTKVVYRDIEGHWGV